MPPSSTVKMLPSSPLFKKANQHLDLEKQKSPKPYLIKAILKSHTTSMITVRAIVRKSSKRSKVILASWFRVVRWRL